MALADERALKTRKNILFVCHESSRTGAPISLLTFIKWIGEHTGQPFSIVIEKGGDLDKAFSALGPTRVIRPYRMNLIQKVWSKVHYPSYVSFRLKSFLEEPVGLVYHNTVSKGFFLYMLKRKIGCPVITHIHELEGVIQSTGISNVRWIKRATDHYLAASRAVKENLIRNHHIPSSDITVHYECVRPIPEHVETTRVLVPLKINESDFVVGGAGFVDQRKGFDIFLETARSLIREYHFSQFKFIWVGAFGRKKQKFVEKFIHENELGDFVCFLGEKKDPYSIFRMFDLFFLTSREDPYPLVMLENAYLGIPVTGFRGSGGIDEFLEKNPELLIDMLTVRHASEKLIQFEKDRKMLKKYGGLLKKKVMENHLMERCGEKFYDNIKRTAGME